jgi:hypothetical protein
MLTLKADENLLTSAHLEEMPFLQVYNASCCRWWWWVFVVVFALVVVVVVVVVVVDGKQNRLTGKVLDYGVKDKGFDPHLNHQSYY